MKKLPSKKIDVPLEKEIQTKIVNFLKKIEGLWFVNVHGGSNFQKSGIPDVLVCYMGQFFGMEIKRPGGKLSRKQRWELQKIANAGGAAVVVFSVEDVMQVLGLEKGAIKSTTIIGFDRGGDLF